MFSKRKEASKIGKLAPASISRRVSAARAKRPTAPDWVNATLVDAPAVETSAPVGCGWFDSSHELNAGLRITEHLSPDDVANEVPLGWWLDWQAQPASVQAVAQLY
jgi:hypothetical protein